jgi:ABC-type amino acid transport substrate-binding protein
MTFFPYEYMENNKPAGFDIEFLAGLAKTMGREAVNIDTRFPNLIPACRADASISPTRRCTSPPSV